MNAAKRREIFVRLQAANPNPTTELEYDTPFQLLIAVLLSAQATDKSVNIATRKFFRARHACCDAALAHRRMRPVMELHEPPEQVGLDATEVGQLHHPYVLHFFMGQRLAQMVMINDIGVCALAHGGKPVALQKLVARLGLEAPTASA